MTTLARLGFQIDSDPMRRATRDMRGMQQQAGRTERDVKRSATSITSVVTKMGAAFAGLGVAAELRNIGRTFADFEQSMARVGAISRATSGQLEKMSDVAKDLGSTTEFTASQAASGFRFLAQAGFEAEEAIAALPSVLNLATAASISLGQSADITSNIMSGFGVNASEAVRISDTLAATASRANTSVTQLGQAMSTVAPVADTLGVTLGEASAAIGLVSDAGIQGQRAGTALRGTFASLASITPKAQKAIEEMGLSVEDVNVEALGFAEVMSRLGAAGINTSQAMEIFGREAASGALVLANGAEKLRGFGQELQNVEGEGTRMAETMRDTLTGDVQALGSAIDGVRISLGEQFAPSMRETAQGATALARSINGFVESDEFGEWLEMTGNAAEVVSLVIGSRMVSALGAAVAAKATATASAIRYQAALASMAGVSRTAAVGLTAMGAAARGASAALALVGGPVGAAVIAAGALFLYRDELNGTAAQARETTRAIDDFTTSLNTSNKAVLQSTLGDLKQELAEIEEQQQAARQRLDSAREAERSQRASSQANGRPVRATVGVREAEQELQETSQQADILSGKIEVVEERLEAVGEVGVTAVNSVRRSFSEVGDEIESVTQDRIEQLRKSASDFADELERVRRIANPARASLMDLGENLDILSRSSLPVEQIRQIQIGLIDAAEGGSELVRSFDAVEQAMQDRIDEINNEGEDAGNKFAEGFERSANRIGDSLADSLINGDWSGVGDTIGATIGASVSDIAGKQIASGIKGALEDSSSTFFSESAEAIAEIGGSALGGAAGGIAGSVISSELNKILSSSEMQRGELAEIKQAQQFTGGVLGSIDAKTQSLVSSLESMESLTDQLVGINRGMLNALQGADVSGSRFAASAMRALPSIDFGGVDIGALSSIGQEFDRVTEDVMDGLSTITLGLSDIMTFGLDDLLGSVGGALFGGGTSTQDRGIRVIGGKVENLIDGSIVEAFERVKIEGGLLGSDKKKTHTARIGGEIEDQFSNTIGNIADSLVEASELLRMDSGRVRDEIEQFVIDTTDISLMDLNAEQRGEEITAFFSDVMDNLSAEVFDWASSFQESGEALGETLTRLATQNAALEEAQRQLGFALTDGTDRTQELTSGMDKFLQRAIKTFGGLSPEQFAGISDSFIEAVGGTEALANQMSQFTSSFFSDAQQFANVEDQLTRALEQQNLQLPKTRDGFVDLLQAQNAARASGQENIATLLRVQGIADEYYDTLEQRQDEAARREKELLDSLRSATDTALGDLRQSIDARKSELQSQLDAELSAIQEREERRLEANEMALEAAKNGLSDLEDAINGITSAADNLRDAYEPLQEPRRERAIEGLRSALESGDLTGTGDLAGIASQISASDFATRSAFEREQGRTLNLLSSLEAEGQEQLTTAEQAVERLEDQTDAIKESAREAEREAQNRHNEQIGRLDDQLDSAQEQVNAIRGVDDSIRDLASAIRAFEARAGGEERGTAAGDATESRVLQLYDSIGRNAESVTQAEIDYWRQSGESGSELRRSFLRAAAGYTGTEFADAATRAQQLIDAEGFADGGIANGPSSGYAATLHGREAIVPIPNGSIPVEMRGGASDDEIRQLRNDLRAANRALLKSNEKIRQLLQGWDQQGIPEERTFA